MPASAPASASAAAFPRVAFVIGGVMKGGTTALAHILARHPAIALPSRKEAHYFDFDRYIDGAMPSVDEYHALWGRHLGVKICGDATPAYCWWPAAAERVRDYNPAMRWVLLLRDPVSRAYSQWNMQRGRGRAAPSFEAALEMEAARGGALRRMSNPAGRREGPSYLSRSRYSEQLERLLNLFPREQLLVMRSEDLQGDPTPGVERVCSFLGVASMGPLPSVTSNVGEYVEPMKPETRARLVALFEDEYLRLEAMLGWDLSNWRR